jgi:hypothetical protein
VAVAVVEKDARQRQPLPRRAQANALQARQRGGKRTLGSMIHAILHLVSEGLDWSRTIRL